MKVDWLCSEVVWHFPPQSQTSVRTHPTRRMCRQDSASSDSWEAGHRQRTSLLGGTQSSPGLAENRFWSEAARVQTPGFSSLTVSEILKKELTSVSLYFLCKTSVIVKQELLPDPLLYKPVTHRLLIIKIFFPALTYCFNNEKVR